MNHCFGVQIDWSWHAHCQWSLLGMGTAKIQKKKAVAVGQAGPPMWITDVLLKHSNNITPFVVLLANPSQKEKETSHVVMRQACQADLNCIDYHHSIPIWYIRLHDHISQLSLRKIKLFLDSWEHTLLHLMWVNFWFSLKLEHTFTWDILYSLVM